MKPKYIYEVIPPFAVRPVQVFKVLKWWERLLCFHWQVYAYVRPGFHGLACLNCARIVKERES